MRDVMEISNEMLQKAENNPLEFRKLFAEALMAEFAKMKGEEIAPHLSCTYEVFAQEYKVELIIPAALCKEDSI